MKPIRSSTNRGKPFTEFQRERINFFMWWQNQKNRDQMSLLKAAWEAWKERASVKAPN